jgi:hypothetical protein
LKCVYCLLETGMGEMYQIVKVTNKIQSDQLEFLKGTSSFIDIIQSVIRLTQVPEWPVGFVFSFVGLKFYFPQYLLMKWLRYQRVISLKTQVGITNQRNKWANTYPWIYRRWDAVPRRSKHPLLIDHTCTRREPSSLMSYRLSKSVCQVRSNYWYEKCQTIYMYCSRKVCNHK